MKTETINQKYITLLGKKQSRKIITLFNEIENGKYDKTEITRIKLKDIKHPFFIRSIRADMQSFINTFIDPYLEPKEYMNNINTVIDAGANIGYTAILFANRWPNSKIISIEPDKENYELALKNTKQYQNIFMIHGALWNKNSALIIEAGQEDGFVVKELKNNSMHPSNNLTNGICIDDIMKQYKLKTIDFLKLNIEGSEKEVFSENYKNWLPKTKTMLVELHDGKNAGCAKTVFNTTNKFNYAVAETASYGVLFVNESDYRKWYANWYKKSIYLPNIDKQRFPSFYLDKQKRL